MLRVLILDDDDLRHEAFGRVLAGVRRRHVRTAVQAIAALERDEPYDLVFLDYDLDKSGDIARDPGCGADVARHIASGLSVHRRPGLVVLHTRNDWGRLRMAGLLRRAGVPFEVRPFGG